MTSDLTLTRAGRLKQAALEFFLAPASPKPLAAFRIGLAGVLLLQAYALSGSLLDLFGSRGIVQWSVLDYTNVPGTPRIGWLTDFFGQFGVADSVVINLMFLGYVAALASMLVGFHTRKAAIVVYLAHTMLKASGTAVVYGVDTFAHIALFYAMFVPMAGAWSLDLAAGRVSGEPSSENRLGLRVLQLHMCIVYFFCGFDKAFSVYTVDGLEIVANPDWWNGEAIWCALIRGDLCPFDMTWIADYPIIAKVLGWGTLVLEMGYPIMMWPRRTRAFWGWNIVALHLGIAVFMSLYSFSAVMIALTASAFLVSAKPAVQVAAAKEETPVTGVAVA